ncbi:MAG: GAF domain-containing protein [Anaerolineae bacterium]|nr:GAF domain-containing protein [Anaerolineae bacterium]
MLNQVAAVNGSFVTRPIPKELKRKPVIEELNQPLDKVQIIFDASFALANCESPREVIEQLLSLVISHFANKNCIIARFEPVSDILYFERIVANGQLHPSFYTPFAKHQGLTSHIIRKQLPLLVANMQKSRFTVDPQLAQLIGPVQSWLGVPLVVQHNNQTIVYGAVVIWSQEPTAFSSQDADLLAALAHLASKAFHSAQMYEANQRHLAEMTMLKRVASALTADMGLEDIVVDVLNHVTATMDVERGVLLLVEPNNNALVMQATFPPGTMPPGFRYLSLKSTLVGRSVTTGCPVTAVQTGQRTIDFNAKSLLSVPLTLDGLAIGALVVINKKNGFFSEADVDLLTTVNAFVSAAFKHFQLQANVLAERDRVLEAEETARKTLARNLHDGPIQQAASLHMQLDFCRALLERKPEMLSDELFRAQSMAQAMVHQMRTTLFEMHPLILKTEGLVPALEMFLERRQADLIGDHRPNLHLQVVGQTGKSAISRLDSDVESAIFAIVQETVNNAIKHAQAKQLVVNIEETEHSIHVKIIDDGQGFDVNEVLKEYHRGSSIGMISIREQAELLGGDLQITSKPGLGTKVELFIPKTKKERLRQRGRTGNLTLPPNFHHF